ncbi:hypothetical protein [Rhizobium leguminosarum]
MVSRAFFQKPDLLYRPATLLVALDRVMMEDRLQLGSPGNEGIRCIALERHICPVFLGLAGHASGSKARRMSVQVQQYLFEVTARDSFSPPHIRISLRRNAKGSFWIRETDQQRNAVCRA